MEYFDTILLIIISLLSGLNTFGIGWIVLRLRTRGIKGQPTQVKQHEHKFAEVNRSKFGDDKRHCNVDNCGEIMPPKSGGRR